MHSSEVHLTARIAKPTDHKLVARLCKRSVGPGDYVLRNLDEVIAKRGLFLALSDGELLGMVNFEECVDGSGWLGMGRTDPKWRRHGVAFFLQQQVTVHARRKGLSCLRLWALSSNKASRLAAKKAGFRPLCEATHVTTKIRTKRRLAPKLLPQGNHGEPLKPLLKSPYLSKMNGYFAYKWHFVKADEELLGRLRKKGELYADGKSTFILTKPEMRFGVRRCAFTMLVGSAASTLEQVKRIARGYGQVLLGSYLPNDTYLLSVARKTGFRRDTWAEHCVVYEKRI